MRYRKIKLLCCFKQGLPINGSLKGKTEIPLWVADIGVPNIHICEGILKCFEWALKINKMW